MQWPKVIERYIGDKPRAIDTLVTWLGGLMVAVLPFLQHWLIWFPDRDNRRYIYGDFIEHFGPRSYIYQAIIDGRLPLWDPYKETGLPTLDYLFDFFNPLILSINLFFLEDGLMRSHAAQMNMVLHYSIGGLGAYLWVKSLGMGRTAAVVMGVFWSSCGFMLIKSAGHDTMIHTTAWAPYMFLFLDKARRTGSLAASGWAGVFLAMVFLGGHPQIFYYFSLMLLIYGIYYAVVFCRLKGVETAWQIMWRTFAPMALMALLFASPQILHSLGSLLGGGLARVYPMGDLGDLVLTGKGHSEFRYLPYFLLPRLERGYMETYLYAGVLPLIFGAVAVYYLHRKEEGYWKAVLITGLVLMMGNSMGLHKVLIDLLPGYVYFRCVSRYMMLVHIAIGMLAAYGVHWLLSSPHAPQIHTVRRGLRILAAILALVLLSALALNHFGISGLVQHDSHYVLNAFSAALVLVGAVWLILQRVAQNRRGPGLRLFIVLVVILDLGFFHWPLTAIERHDFYPDPSRVTQKEEDLARQMQKTVNNQPVRYHLRDEFIKPSVAYKHGLLVGDSKLGYLNRIFSRPFWELRWRTNDNPRFIDLLGVGYIEPKKDVLKSFRTSWKLVRGSQSAIDLQKPTRLRKIAIDANAPFTDGLKPGETIAWLALARNHKIVAKRPLRWGKEISGARVSLDLPAEFTADEILLSSSHPRALVDINKVWLNDQPAADRVRYEPADMKLCKNLRALPLAFFVQRAAVMEPDPEYLDALTSVDPSRCVLFRKAPAGYQLPGEPTADAGGKTEMVSFEPQRVELKVKARNTGYVVMSQTASFGWTARLDGNKVPIYRAYGFLCTVQVPPGDHTLVFSYDEPLVKAGLVLMVLSFIGLIFFSVWCRRIPWCRGYKKG